MVNSCSLKTVRFVDTKQWNVKHFFATSIISKYSTESIGKHTIHITEKTKLFNEPEKEHKILGISNEKGMFDAYAELGKNINQAYIYVENGCLAYNPYRINVGSIGLKTDLQKNEYISPAYVVFKCKETILPEFLYLVLKSTVFNSIIRENTTGSVRQTLSYDNLATIKIPVPPIETQRNLLDEYHSTLKEAQNIQEEAEKLNDSINDEICDLLGITLPQLSAEVKKGLQLIKYSECEKWSVDYLLNKDSCEFIGTTKYPVVRARQFIKECQYGLSDKATKEKCGIPVLRMNNLQKSNIDTSDLKYLPDSTKGIERYLLNQGDLLFNRTNSKELVGKTAVFSLTDKYVFASYLIRVVINSDIADVNYINYLFASKIIRSQIDLFSRQILGQANINVDELKSLKFPLPPLPEQKKIVTLLKGIEQKSKQYLKKSIELKGFAKLKFEEAVFGETQKVTN